MKRAVLAAGVVVALALSVFAPGMAAAATSLNGAKFDPQNLIDDALENEALAAYARHAAQRPFRGDEIVIVDYALPSTAKRLYIADIRTGTVEAHYVAHGRGSDPSHSKLAVRFSDAETSGMSSVGAYRGMERYRSGTHGPALKLEGLDPTNASAYRRLIVFHTAPYFDPQNGRAGRSCGCFVVTKGDMTRVYDVIADGGFLYAGPARLHDPSATAAADCNTACGNTCPNAPLMAKVAPAPQPRQPAPVVVAALKAESGPAKAMRADLDAPVPLAKPKLDAAIAVAAAFDAPIPRRKPSLRPEAIDGDARQAAIALLARRNAPRLVVTDSHPPPAPATSPSIAMSDIPMPQAKPVEIQRATMPQIAVAPLVPDVAPGETPVPSAKPAGLPQTADLGGRS